MADHGNTNPGNFANRPTEEVQAIASKGGKASHGITEPVTEKTHGNPDTGNQGFASMDPAKQHEIASMGGKASAASGSDNPGNFANRPKEEVQAIAAKGGRASHGALGDDDAAAGSTGGGTTSDNPGNFANRPKEEVRAIASKGGKAS